MCHVLIIEDQPLIAMTIQSMLEDVGAASFDVAASESEAVDCAIAHHPDFITSDVRLADGTGPVAVERIFDGIGEVPVVFITATPDASIVRYELSSLLTKPFKADALQRAFRLLAPRCCRAGN